MSFLSLFRSAKRKNEIKFREACKDGDLNTVQEILQLKAGREVDFNAEDSGGKTALMFAVLGGHEAIVLTLLQATIPYLNVNKKDKDGNTSLIHSCQALATSTSSPLPQQSFLPAAPVYSSRVSAAVNICKLLLQDRRIDINVSNEAKWTALHTIAGINVNDDSVLAAAVTDLIGLLLGNTGHIDINAVTRYGRSALHVAAESGNLMVALALVEQARMKLDMTDKEGWTAAHLARKHDNVAIAQVIEAAIEKQRYQGLGGLARRFSDWLTGSSSQTSSSQQQRLQSNLVDCGPPLAGLRARSAAEREALISLVNMGFSRASIECVLANRISNNDPIITEIDEIVLDEIHVVEASLTNEPTETEIMPSNVHVEAAEIATPSAPPAPNLDEGIKEPHQNEPPTDALGKGYTDETATATECKICMDSKADHVFIPCGHMMTCEKCSKDYTHCPMCRQKIDSSHRVFQP